MHHLYAFGSLSKFFRRIPNFWDDFLAGVCHDVLDFVGVGWGDELWEGDLEALARGDDTSVEVDMFSLDGYKRKERVKNLTQRSMWH